VTKMKETDIKLAWDGEAIKQTVKIADRKLSPKEIIDSLENVKHQLTQMTEQKTKLETQIKNLESDMRQAKDFEADRKPFEEKCWELQIEKLKNRIAMISEEKKKQALEQAKAIIDKDPNAYTPEQKTNLKYVQYQRLISTDKKIADKISSHVIRKHLFENPCFDNPF